MRKLSFPRLLTPRARHFTARDADGLRTVTEVDVINGEQTIATFRAVQDEGDHEDSAVFAYNLAERAAEFCETVEDVRRALVNYDSRNSIPTWTMGLIGYRLVDGYRIREVKLLPFIALMSLVTSACYLWGMVSRVETGVFAFTLIVAEVLALGLAGYYDGKNGETTINYLVGRIGLQVRLTQACRSTAPFTGPYRTAGEVLIMSRDEDEPDVYANISVLDSKNRIVQIYETDHTRNCDSICDSVVTMLAAAECCARDLTKSEGEAHHLANAALNRFRSS